MYKPKHLKKSRYTFNSKVALIASVLTFATVLITCVVPVGGNADAQPVELDIVVTTTPTSPMEDTSWVPVATPLVMTIPTPEIFEEESSLNPNVTHPAMDLSIMPGELYTAGMLDEWDEIAIVGLPANSEEVLELVAKCRELLSYECYRGETLVQALAKTVTAEIGGLTDYRAYSTTKMEEAAVIWCILNRVDTYYEDGKAEHVETIVKAKHQFAYRSWTEIHPGMEDIVIDVLIRWQLEKSGLLEDCGRVLPQEYLFFHGDGYHNHFRTKYDRHDIYGYWNWSLPDPYKEG